WLAYELIYANSIVSRPHSKFPRDHNIFITSLSLTASLLGTVAATGNSVHLYAQLRAWGQPGCRAGNLGEEGIYGDYTGSCVPLDKTCKFTGIYTVNMNGLRFLSTNASVANTSIKCTNWCAMTETNFPGSGSQSNT
ncbi:hypothetical protein N7475_000165, partial [Penicillium sp. IBT 31633x]